MPDDGPVARAAKLMGVAEAVLEPLLDAWTRTHDLKVGTVLAVLRGALDSTESAAQTAKRLDMEEATVLAIANAALAARWQLDEARLNELTSFALWARNARAVLGYDPPMWRPPHGDRPEGAWTAGEKGTLPMGRKQLKALAAALEAAIKVYDETMNCMAAWEPLAATVRAARGDDGELYALRPFLDEAADWARQTLPAGSKPRPSAGAGWEGDAAALAALGCRERGWPISTNHRGEKTKWEEFGGTWLRLLGVRQVETLVRNPPSTSRLAAMRADVNPPRVVYRRAQHPVPRESPEDKADGNEAS